MKYSETLPFLAFDSVKEVLLKTFLKKNLLKRIDKNGSCCQTTSISFLWSEELCVLTKKMYALVFVYSIQ